MINEVHKIRTKIGKILHTNLKLGDRVRGHAKRLPSSLGLRSSLAWVSFQSEDLTRATKCSRHQNCSSEVPPTEMILTTFELFWGALWWSGLFMGYHEKDKSLSWYVATDSSGQWNWCVRGRWGMNLMGRVQGVRDVSKYK